MNRQPGKKKKRKLWLWLAAAGAAVLVIVIMIVTAGRGSTAFSQEEAVRRDIVTYYSFSGNLTPVYDEVQTAKEAVKVKELYVAEGDHVTEGQPLLRGSDGSRVYAAHDGVVDALIAENDDQLQPGSQIARIVDYDQLEVSVNVDEYDIGAISLGKEGTVYLNALDLSVPGKVTEIARSATTEAGVSYFAVKLAIDAQEGVRSGMSVEVSILNQHAPNAVALPLSVISYDETNTPYVLIRDEQGKPTAVTIKTGVSNGEYVEIVSGLSEGQIILYHGSNMARFYAMRENMMSQSGM